MPYNDVESFSQDKIQVDIKDPPVSPRQIVAQQQDEPDSDLGGAQDSGGVQDYTLVRDREPHRITHPVRYGFEDFATIRFLPVQKTLLPFERLWLAKRNINGWVLSWARWNP